jgi:uracil-DNA glycosylase family 4
MAEDRLSKLEAIAAEVNICTKCRLHEGRTHGVPGAGNPYADIMFVGEGPGFHEDQQGLPFVGRSGDYLTRLLKGIGLTRDDVFIANVVKCRPPDNRDPMPDEIATCKAYLDHQIDIIDPLVIATLGRFSMARYFPDGKISQIHGQPKYGRGRAYYPFYHPAAALRNPRLQQDMEADMKRLLDVLEKVKTMRASGAVPSVSASPSPTESAAPTTPVTPDTPDEPEDPPQQLPLF